MRLDPAVCERARQSRDARFDGRFFIGVLTTGVYCRPVCPARSPLPRNVRFYPTAAAAAEDGLRPCLRCRPETAPGTSAWAGTSATVARALRLIAAGALDRGGVEELADPLGVTPRHLSRLFVQHLGASPKAVAQTRRLHFAKRLIDETRLPMADVALSSGFKSVRRFNDAFRATYSRSPSALRSARGREPHEAATVEESPIALRLAFRPPYDWGGLIEFLGPRAIPRVEEVSRDAYRRTIRVDGQAGLIEVRPVADRHCVRLEVRQAGPRALFGIAERIRRLFDLDADSSVIANHLERDPLLAPVVGRRPGLRVPGAWDGFELGVRAILGQQVSVKGATTLAGRIVEAYGDPLPAAAGDGLTHLFPTARRLARADLSRIGLPGARAGAINAFARACAEGRLGLESGRSFEEIAGRLTGLSGIGRWTAEYVALRALGDPDAFPSTDLGLVRAAGFDAGPRGARRLAERAEAWRPWRAYAAMYLWQLYGKQSATPRPPRTRRSQDELRLRRQPAGPDPDRRQRKRPEADLVHGGQPRGTTAG